MSSAPLRFSIALCALALGATALGLGCGAKSGLLVPDAGIDAGPDAALEPSVVCIEVVDPGVPVRAALSLPVNLRAIDVLLLIDATASMEDEIANVRSRLSSTVLPGIRDAIPDVELGLALVGEFPVFPHGPDEVAPYELRAPIGTSALQLEGALGTLPTWGNFDLPEAHVEGLYQVATGEGLPTFIEPAFGCPGGGLGGGCFRSEAFSIILLITDAPMHNGPPGVDPIDPYRFSPAPHSYQDAVDALGQLGAVVIGLGAQDAEGLSPLPHLRALARDTGAVDGDGNPLVFDIGSSGTRTGDGVIESLTRLASDLPLDVHATARDGDGDSFDASTLVVAVRPDSALPASGIGSMDATTFFAVLPGTEVTFSLELDPVAVANAPKDTPLPVHIVFQAGRSTLGEREVLIVIPGPAAAGCATRPQ